ncbi:MAG: tetratricopeptide repeat protein, partial [Polyangiaceae bacterium]|nr:tetratricopeptide repeat protein [Polyangiaceae bacterium]
PTYWRVAYWLGRVEETIGNKPAAEKHYAEAIALADTRHLDAVLPYASYAVLLASSNRAADAKAKLEEAQKKLQDSSILQRAFGDVNASQGSFDIALQHYRSAVEKDPNDPTSHFKLATMFRKTRKNDEALQELEKVEKIDKEFPGLVVERGLLFEATGKTDKAIEQFKAALQKAPDDLDLQLRIGYAYIAVNQPAEAETLLRKVLEKRQDSAQANHALGRALLVQGDAHVSEALRYLKRAVELDPNRAENHLYVAWACNDVPQPQLGLAKAEIERALALDNLLADAYWQRGILLRKEGAVENAIKDLKRALELKPSRVEAHAALAEAYEDKNLPDLAISEWRLAVNTGTVKHHNWNYRFGRLLLAQGNRGEALTQLLLAVNDAEKAEVKPGWLTQSQFHTAELLKNAGRRQEAIERYKKYLEGAGNNSPDRRDAIKSLAELGAPWER